jgi:transposase
VVREPSFEEQRDRFYYRHRRQLIGIREKEGAYGRSLLHDLGIHDAPEGWWGKIKWPAYQKQLAEMGQRAAFALEIMIPLQELIQHTHSRILELDKKLNDLHTQKITIPMPKGLGDATATAIILELMDPARFKNRKQVGSWIGCGICEYSTGTGQTLGSIDKMGNGRIRSALTEAIWRLIKWEPGWRGFKKWGDVLTDKKAGKVSRKKAIIACVRLLMIDLWRLFTGRATLERLGFVGGPVPAAEQAA